MVHHYILRTFAHHSKHFLTLYIAITGCSGRYLPANCSALSVKIEIQPSRRRFVTVGKYLASKPRCIEGLRKLSKNALYTLYSVKKCLRRSM